VLFFRDYRYQKGGRGAKRQWKSGVMIAECGGKFPDGKEEGNRGEEVELAEFRFQLDVLQSCHQAEPISSWIRCLAAANCLAAS
jgi:hypothetical protein